MLSVSYRGRGACAARAPCATAARLRTACDLHAVLHQSQVHRDRALHPLQLRTHSRASSQRRSAAAAGDPAPSPLRHPQRRMPPQSLRLYPVLRTGRRVVRHNAATQPATSSAPPPEDEDAAFMHRALELARRGLGRCCAMNNLYVAELPGKALVGPIRHDVQPQAFCL